MNRVDVTQSEEAPIEEGQLSLDVYETAKELIIVAPIAGVKLEDINITITEDVLTIKGHRESEQTAQDDDFIIQECFWGDFSRSIVLPDNVDTSKINASFKNGVLTVSMPKVPGGIKTKLIKIKAA